MAQEVRAYLDEDLYDEVCDEHDSTGKSKSQIINEHVRESLESNGGNWFMRSFAQALFVVGFVVAFYQTFAVGVATSFIGLSLMLWSQVQEHASKPNTSYWDAFKRTLGV